MVEKLVINTSIGKGVVNLKDLVLCPIPGGFLEKPAYDLNIGESIVFNRKFVAADLKEVEPYLLASDRYSLAKRVLHEINEGGAYIPKLRTELIRGLANRGVINESGLEAKILLQEGGDLDAESYKKMTRFISNLLLEKKISISTSAIKQWLSGETISPRDWDIYNVLKNINPIFLDFGLISEDRGAYFFNYKLYTTVRQGIMRYLSNPRHPPFRSPKENDSFHTRVFLSPEIDLVLDHFVRDIDEEYAASQILEIKKIDETQLKKNENILKQGILTERVDRFEKRKKPIDKFLRGKKIAYDIFFKLVKSAYGNKIIDYISEKISNESPQVVNYFFDELEAFPKDIKINLFATAIIDDYFSVRGEPRFLLGKQLIFLDMGNLHEFFKELIDEFTTKLYDGSIDTSLKLHRGDSLLVFDLLKREHLSTPNSLLKYSELLNLGFKSITIMNSSLSTRQELSKLMHKPWKELKKEFKKGTMSIMKQIKKLEWQIRTDYPYFCGRNIEQTLEYTPQQQEAFIFESNLPQLFNILSNRSI